MCILSNVDLLEERDTEKKIGSGDVSPAESQDAEKEIGSGGVERYWEAGTRHQGGLAPVASEKNGLDE